MCSLGALEYKKMWSTEEKDKLPLDFYQQDVHCSLKRTCCDFQAERYAGKMEVSKMIYETGSIWIFLETLDFLINATVSSVEKLVASPG